MTDRELRRLSRAELLEIMLEQSREIDRLKARVDELSRQVQEKKIILSECGSIAEAALKLNHIFEAAQKAADQYVHSVKSFYEV
jgi:cell division septum initiation protein DivIVA